MTNREKIILIIMFFTIIWGWYMLFYDSDKSTPSKASTKDSIDADRKLIADLAMQLSQQKPSIVEKEVLKSAATAWTKDPFLSPSKGLHAKKAETTEKSEKQSSPKVGNWLYSGYLEVGGKRLAIINGQEYEEGESLFPIGYYLYRVHKNHVTIGTIGKNTTFTLPLTEP